MSYHQHDIAAVSRSMFDDGELELKCSCGAMAKYSEKWGSVTLGSGDWSKAEHDIRSGAVAL